MPLTRTATIALIVVGGLAVSAAGFAIAVVSRQVKHPAVQPGVPPTASLDLLKKSVRDLGWEVPDMPRLNFGPGALLASTPQGPMFRSKLSSCITGAQLEVRKGGSAFPSTSASFSLKGGIVADAFGMAQLSGSGSSTTSVDVRPSHIEEWAVDSGAVRDAIRKRWTEFRSRCLSDSRNGGAIVVDALVATELEISLTAQSALEISASAQALESTLKNDPKLTIQRKDDTTLRISNTALIVGFHSMLISDLLPEAKAALRVVPTKLVASRIGDPLDVDFVLDGNVDVSWRLVSWPEQRVKILPPERFGTLSRKSRSKRLWIIPMANLDSRSRLTTVTADEREGTIVVSYSYKDGLIVDEREVSLPVSFGREYDSSAAPTERTRKAGDDIFFAANAYHLANSARTSEAVAEAEKAIKISPGWGENPYMKELLASIAIKEPTLAQSPVIGHAVVNDGAFGCATKNKPCLSPIEWDAIRIIVARKRGDSEALRGIIDNNDVNQEEFKALAANPNWNAEAKAAIRSDKWDM